MKFELTIRPYTAGIGQPKKDVCLVFDGATMTEAIEQYYSAPDFNPEYRIVNARSVVKPGVPSDKSV